MKMIDEQYEDANKLMQPSYIVRQMSAAEDDLAVIDVRTNCVVVYGDPKEALEKYLRTTETARAGL